ncbi:MAG: ATP-dependent DNA helicase [Flaviflexus sp.]|nr:ATP-dependent DNA helicase [Flaviflexus sp.]
MGGSDRAGQQEMVRRVAEALDTGGHLIIQAGTGTGKSLGYLAPVASWALKTGSRAIVSTATLALQRQITAADAPAVIAHSGGKLTVAVLKGWHNYACLKRVNEDMRVALPIDGGATDMGEEVNRAREWALTTDTGDRDDLVPGVPDKVWSQISINKQECEGKDCPLIEECFAESARLRAHAADIVVTNHAMLGVHSMGLDLLPHADAVIIDEAHELVGRVTSQLTVRISRRELNRIARMIRSAGASDRVFNRRADALIDVLAERDGRMRRMPEEIREALVGLSEALAAEVEKEQWANAFQADIDTLVSGAGDVVLWARDESLYGAPLDVAGPIADRIFDERAVVLTSATLEIGRSFTPMAVSVGLAFPSQGPWQGIDVGSPFDYQSQGILYIADDLPAPGRGGPSEEMLQRLADLVTASGGGALGLFSSRRAAEVATDYLREVTGLPILCQGEDQLSTLVEEFRADEQVSLFGTISLWQGIDVPGPTCRLVVIDRIPFPRPDDPVASARTELVGKRGGNGFMQISATHAAVLLAQGAGRLLRSRKDRGVVAVLDSRLATQRYGGYLRSSMPPMWPTGDRDIVLGALSRLSQAARGDNPEEFEEPGECEDPPASGASSAEAGPETPPEEESRTNPDQRGEGRREGQDEGMHEDRDAGDGSSP